jgi:hypothetical protein
VHDRRRIPILVGMTELHVLEPAVEPDEPLRAWAGGAVPAGHTVETGYLPIHDVVCLASFGHQLYPAEVERAYRDRLELDGAQAWPPPTGYRRADGRFVLTDGRNRYVAALMLGVEHLLVAWLAPPR